MCISIKILAKNIVKDIPNMDQSNLENYIEYYLRTMYEYGKTNQKNQNLTEMSSFLDEKKYKDIKSIRAGISDIFSSLIK